MKLKFWTALSRAFTWLSFAASDAALYCASKASFANVEQIIQRQRDAA